MSSDGPTPIDLSDVTSQEITARIAALVADGVASTELVDLMLEADFRQAFSGEIRFQYLEKVRLLTKQLDYKRGRCWVLVMDSGTHYLRSNLNQALEGFVEARKLAADLNDSRLNGILDSSLADVHKALGNYETAFRYAIDSLAEAQKAGNEMQEAWLLQGISSGSNDLGDHNRALEYAARGKEIFERILQRSEEMQARAGVARCLTEIGMAHHRLGNSDEAVSHHVEALSHYRTANNLIGEARALNDLGRAYQDQGIFEKAEDLHRRSLEIRTRVKNRQSQATSLLNLGDLDLARGNAASAILYLNQALEIAVETGARLRQFQVHEALARAYEADGALGAALKHHREFHQIREEVSNDSINGRIADLQMRFEIERAEKEAEIAHLRNVELKETNERLNDLLDELRSAQDRLVHAEKMASLGAMTAGIAHEIKNPLNFVTNFAALSIDLSQDLENAIRDEVDASLDPSKNRDGLVSDLLNDLQANAKRILDHGRRADSILKNMLMHASGQSPQRRPVDLNELVEEYVDVALGDVGAQYAESTFSVEMDLDFTIGQVEVAPKEIGRVILNLLSNAFDAVSEYTDGGPEQPSPKVLISTRNKDDWIELAVEDNGSGIPEEKQHRIFEPFFTTKPTGSGTGLGLSLSYDIVVLGHGGEIFLNAQSGLTTFVVRLPKTRGVVLDTGR